MGAEPSSAPTFRPKIEEKRWSKEIEKELLSKWSKEKLYEFNPEREGPILIIDTPPPYPSGKWHVGGAAHYAQIDMIARYFRMKGWNVFVPWYADRNGLPVEVAVEKKYKIVAHEMAKTKEGRLKFLELCSKELDKIEEELVRIWSRLGCSFTYIQNGTDSPEYRRITQATFIELWRRGLIYEAERPVNWCPRCRTTLSEAEIEHREEDAYLYYVKWKVKETGEEIVIATTRPELIGAARAVVYNPEDERYKRLKGLHAIVPIYGYEVPILEHPAAKPEFGTGLVMVSSYGDWTDVQMLKDLGLEPKVIVNYDGTLNEKAGFLQGLPIREARRRIVEELEKHGLIEKKESLRHSVPICWRCKTPVEIVHVREYFLKQLEFKDKLREIALKVHFRPEKHRRKLLDWIDSLKMDWPISRTRYYGTEIPLWTCRRCGAKLVPEPGRYYRPWLEEPPWDKCPKCGAPRSELEGEKRVFDTWFDSSISVLYASGYMRNPRLFERAFPQNEELPYTMRPQGLDIIRTWLYFTMLRVYQLLGKPAFRWIRVTGMGLDPTGRTMHKSLGNVIDPEPYIETYGAEPFRFWAAAAARLGDDYRFSEQVLKTGKLFLTKLWNISRFVSSFPRPAEGYKLRPIDLAFLGALNELIKRVDRYYGEELDVHQPINELYNFTWNVFAAHYIEIVKTRAYNREGEFSEEEQKAAWYTLHAILDALLRMLAPILPFITDALYRRLYGKSVHQQQFPEPNPEWSTDYAKMLDKILSLNSAVWSWKRSHGYKLSDKVEGYKLYVSKDLEPFIKDLSYMHKIEIVVKEPPPGAEKLTDDVYIAKAQPS
ncbi:Valyl-tRNA synthetase [Pyrodictium delaneyi]|uniref:Valine--tRNA ligase n=1 Tax=Pyrodictium delaneyi TaxID=1273541 RepID=A0A0P0N596_9CREN|nr:valine--tRNA ligase [Pyrodictium delaneyi]ALL01661.1 Valyl-tRNA synthetase [Pyrodictium delaneyi]OWJ55106.1 valine--tRNA ligase [Pyrodictium delaneyi]